VTLAVTGDTHVVGAKDGVIEENEMDNFKSSLLLSIARKANDAGVHELVALKEMEDDYAAAMANAYAAEEAELAKAAQDLADE